MDSGELPIFEILSHLDLPSVVHYQATNKHNYSTIEDNTPFWKSFHHTMFNINHTSYNQSLQSSKQQCIKRYLKLTFINFKHYGWDKHKHLSTARAVLSGLVLFTVPFFLLQYMTFDKSIWLLLEVLVSIFGIGLVAWGVLNHSVRVAQKKRNVGWKPMRSYLRHTPSYPQLFLSVNSIGAATILSVSLNLILGALILNNGLTYILLTHGQALYMFHGSLTFLPINHISGTASGYVLLNTVYIVPTLLIFLDKFLPFSTTHKFLLVVALIVMALIGEWLGPFTLQHPIRAQKDPLGGPPLPYGYMTLVVLIPFLSVFHLLVSPVSSSTRIWYFAAPLCLLHGVVSVLLLVYEMVNNGAQSWAWPSFLIPVTSMLLIVTTGYIKYPTHLPSSPSGANGLFPPPSLLIPYFFHHLLESRKYITEKTLYCCCCYSSFSLQLDSCFISLSILF